MRRWNALALTILSITTLGGTFLLVTSEPAAAATGLKARLADARHELRFARRDLAAARAAYQAAVAADPLQDLTPLKDARAKAKRHIRVERARIARLRKQLRLQNAIRRGNWMPLIKVVAAQRHVSAAGLYHLMMLESGGCATANGGQFYGLFQYCTSAWHGAWNPYRKRSVFDGESQIRATALAIHRGWGSQMWPNTYPMSF